MFKYQKFFANVAVFVATMFPASILANQESADKIEVDFSHERGRIKPLHIKYRIAKGDSALKKIGSLKEGEKLTLSANSVLLLTTREVNVASARNKKIKVSARNINGLDG